MIDPGGIANDEPLMGGSLCPDSLDALELAICVEEEFGIAICGGKESSSAFTTIANLAKFIHASALKSPARPCRTARTRHWNAFRSATTIPPSANRPVFVRGAILTF